VLGHIRSLARPCAYYPRPLSTGGSRSHTRRSGRSRGFFLARHRAGDPRLGGSAPMRRLECVKVPARDKILLLKAPVQTRPPLKSRRPSSVMTASSLERTPDHRSFERIRSRTALAAQLPHRRRRSPAKASFAVGSLHRREVCEPRNPVRRQLANGSWCSPGRRLNLLAGTGSSPEGDRPYSRSARSEDPKIRTTVSQR